MLTPPPGAACARSYCRPKERGCRYTAHKRRRIAGRPCGKVVFFNGGSGSRRGTFSCPRHPQRVSGELQSRELIDCRPYCRPAPLGPSLKNGCRHTHCWRCSGYLGRSADRVRAYNATRNAQKCAPIAKTHHIMQFLLAQGQRTYCRRVVGVRSHIIIRTSYRSDGRRRDRALLPRAHGSQLSSSLRFQQSAPSRCPTRGLVQATCMLINVHAL